MSRRLETRLRAAEEQMERRHPRPHAPNPVWEFMRAYPQTIGLWSDLADAWLTMRPMPPSFEQAAALNPEVDRLMAAIEAAACLPGGSP